MILKKMNPKMNSKEQPDLSVYAIGNALVDNIALVENELLSHLELMVGRMNLATREKQEKILHFLENEGLISDKKPGGSAANTVWTVACFASAQKSVFIGQLAHDPLGDFFIKEMKKKWIELPVLPLQSTNGMTGTSIVLTTPDAERTMSTHLGINNQLTLTHVREETLARAKFCYLEGYLWTDKKHRDIGVSIFEIAQRKKVPVALSFSDPGVVEQFLKKDQSLIDSYVDVIFTNAEEALFFSGESTVEKAMQKLLNGSRKRRVFLTLGADGCLIGQSGQKSEHIPGFQVKAIDTTGAGDAFAGGALATLLKEDPLSGDLMGNMRDAAYVGNYIASEVVTLHGSRVYGHYKIAEILAGRVGVERQ